MIEQTINSSTFYEALRPELERKANLCPGCKYTLELLPKFSVGQTNTTDNEKWKVPIFL